MVVVVVLLVVEGGCGTSFSSSGLTLNPGGRNCATLSYLMFCRLLATVLSSFLPLLGPLGLGGLGLEGLNLEVVKVLLCFSLNSLATSVDSVDVDVVESLYPGGRNAE